MKRFLLNLGVLLCATAMMVSCGGDITCDTECITASVLGKQGAIHFNDGPCEVIYAPEWVKLTVKENVVNYTIAANGGATPRESCVVIDCDDTRFAISIIQGIKTSYLILSEKKVKLSNDGDTVRVALLTDGGEVEITPNPIVRTTFDGTYLTLISGKNEGVQRVGSIRLKSGRLARTLSFVIEGEKCPTCNGTGYLTCKKCGGRGLFGNGTASSIVVACTACGGRGEAIYSMRHDSQSYRDGSGRVPCPTCNKK